MPVDLRSDTVTRPTPAMRAAIAAAEVGDDVYGEDPTVRALEERVADLLGHEAGLYVPSGSMGNQLALRLLVAPGQELLCEAQAHVARAELGAAAVLSGITTRTWSDPDGRLDVARVRALVAPATNPYLVGTAAVAVENTHNFGGGTVQPLDALVALRALADAAGLGVHLDGARLWNACAATGRAPREYAVLADTVMVSFSKGLGAPVGAVLGGSATHVAEARVWRKRLGGGMRQAGLLAAAALHGLDHHAGLLGADHARARRLADGLAEVAPSAVDPGRVETNIVLVDTADAPAVVAAAAERGVLVSALDPRTVRLVTHLDVDDDGVALALDVLRPLLA